VSFQITVLKVLAAHPDGRASLADLKRYMAVLASSGPDWSQRMKRLAARAPGLDIFSDRLVIREQIGWRNTDAGRELLSSIEAPAEQLAPAEPLSPPAGPSVNMVLSSNVIPLSDHRRRRSAAAA
jgi:hypothetical protein